MKAKSILDSIDSIHDMYGFEVIKFCQIVLKAFTEKKEKFVKSLNFL